MRELLSQVRWRWVLFVGVLIVILVVILNIVLLLFATFIWHRPDQHQIVIQVSSWSTYILLLLLTISGAVWVAGKVERERPVHGLLVGLVVGFMLFLLSRGFGSPLLAALVTFVLNAAAGYIGGVLGNRGHKTS